MITTFTRFDLANLFGQPVRSLVQLALIVVLGIYQPLPGMGLMVAVLTVTLTAATPFLADERGRLDTLYALLPLRRRDVVLGRYLTLLGYAVIALVVGTLTTVLVAAARGQRLDGGLLGVGYAAAVLIIAVALSVQLPAFFRFGYARARFMMFVPALVLAAVFVIMSRIGLLGTGSLAALATVNPVLLLVGAVLVGAVLLAASASLSVRWYRARSL